MLNLLPGQRSGIILKVALHIHFQPYHASLVTNRGGLVNGRALDDCGALSHILYSTKHKQKLILFDFSICLLLGCAYFQYLIFHNIRYIARNYIPALRCCRHILGKLIILTLSMCGCWLTCSGDVTGHWQSSRDVYDRSLDWLLVLFVKYHII